MSNNTQNPSNDYLAAQDDFTRQMTQAKSLLIALSSDDQSSTMTTEHVGGALWLLLDRLDDMNASHQKLIASIKGS